MTTNIRAPLQKAYVGDLPIIVNAADSLGFEYTTAAEIQALIDATALAALQGQLTDGQIPSSIMRDAELTAAVVRNLLNLTETEVNDLLVGASLTGNTLLLPQNDGSSVSITLPSTGMAVSDGVVASGALSGQTLTLTLSTGATVDIDLGDISSDVERNALETKVEAQIDHLSDIIAHGEGYGTETSVDGSHVQNVITFTIPASMRAAPGDYNVKLTLVYAVQAGTQFRLAHDIMFAVAGTGALAGEVPARTHAGGRGIRGTFHISWLAQAITAEAAAIQVTATVTNFAASMISFTDDSHATFTLVDAAADSGVTANPVGDATAELETVQIGDTVFQVQVGRQSYIGGQTAYSQTDNQFTTNISNDAIREPRLGDTVIFQLPDSFNSNDTALNLAVVYDNGTASHPLENSHGAAVSTSELQGGSTLEAVLVLPDGNNRKWRMIEPPLDLTEAQVRDDTSTLFGVVSGQRLAQAINEHVENFARPGTSADVPFTRLPDLIVFKSGSRPPGSGEQGAPDDRVSGQHVLWWNTDDNHMFVHDGGSGTMWNALTFGTAAFLVGSGTPSVNTGSPGSLFMEITRDGDGNITNWYVWTKNDSNVWVNRFEVPIQSDTDVNALVRAAVPAQGTPGVLVTHTVGNLIEVQARLTEGFYPVIPDSNGNLRNPTFVEWRQQTPGFDRHGNQYLPKRRFVGATGGMLTTIADGEFVTRNSITYRFRGFHHNDNYVDSPMHRNVYFTLTGSHFQANIWRTWAATDTWETTSDPFGHFGNNRAVYRGIAVDDDSALHDTTTVGDIYVVGNSSTQTFELKTVSELPTAGTAEYYWEQVHAGTVTDLKYVTALPDPEDAATADYGRIWVVRANETSVPTNIAHLAVQDPHIWHMVVDEDPNNSDRYGWEHNDYGRADQNRNVRGLYERPDGNNWLTVMVVNTNDADNPVRVTNQRQEVFIRKAGATTWQRRHVSNGSAGTYTGTAHADRDLELGHEYEIVVRNAPTEIHADAEVTDLPTTNLYTFYTNSVKFVSIPDLDELGRVQYQVQEIINRTVAVPGEISESDIEDDDGTTTGLISGRRFEAAFANKFSEVADEAAALAASSAGDTTVYWWPTT